MSAQQREVHPEGREAALARRQRWLVAGAAAVMQGAVGATYAWSVFRDPLSLQHGWSIPEVTLAYSLNILGLGIFAFVGGLWMRQAGPRTVGLVAGLLYGLGLMLAGLAGDRLWAFYVGFGLIGGIGRGLGWVASMTMAVRWFPERRGLTSGVTLAGNGLGALIAAPLATGLIESIGVLPALTASGAVLLILVSGAALALREPPDAECRASQVAQTGPDWRYEYRVGEALRTPQWYGLWALLFVSSSAGLALFSQAAPMARELTGIDAMAAAGVVAVMSVANTGGRCCLAWLSDLVGRRLVFAAMLCVLAVALRLLPLATSVGAFAALAAVVMLCFGGGLGTMPAFAADYFGPRHLGPIMGLLMTAQGAAGLVGPLLLATARAAFGWYEPALSPLAVVLLFSAALALVLRPPRAPFATGAGAVRPVAAHATR
jgi:OFA family oxalate/formate antiporter-like MFS transporter